jgi:hypothetical protein
VTSQLLHYVLAFAGGWCLGRQLGLGRVTAGWLALVYVYGWFPARICLEWAILGGAFQVWMLWLLVKYRQQGGRYLLGAMALLLGTHLLAGHYNLAFITLLAVGSLALIPGAWLRGQDDKVLAAHDALPRRITWLGLAILGGFLIGSVQLVPTWELKGLSQRAETGETFAPGYGHLPPLAITQLAAPWLWHGAEIDTDHALQVASWGTIPAATNKAEAYVYAGLLPFLLTLYGWLKLRQFDSLLRRKILLWTGVLIVSLLFATGWPIVWLQKVPGFAFFMGPGRYTVLSTLALAVISGLVLEDLLQGMNAVSKTLLLGVLALLTTADLWGASREYAWGSGSFFGRQVFYATLIDQPPTRLIPQSEIGSILDAEPGEPRLYGPGPNAPTLTGHSAIPVYLGIGPKAYVEIPLRFGFDNTASSEDVQDTVNQLAGLGVTHLLLEAPIREDLWPVELLFSGIDPFLNRIFGRSEPYFLYRLRPSRGRAWLIPDSAGQVTSVESRPNKVTIEVDVTEGAQVVLAELMYPGWTVEIDGQAASPNSSALLRETAISAGKHVITWSYRPLSVLLGTGFTVLGLLLACGLMIPWAKMTGRGAMAGRP